jgi:hypothetical protein
MKQVQRAEQYNFKPGELVRILKSKDLHHLVKSSYEDWLCHKTDWDDQLGIVISSDAYLNGKVQVSLPGEVIYISKIFLELVQSPSEDDTMYQEVRNGTGNCEKNGR